MAPAWRNFKNIFFTICTWPNRPVGAKILSGFQLEGKTDVWISQVRRVKPVWYMTKSITLANLNSITVWLGLWRFMEAANRAIHLLCWSNDWNFRIWVDDGSLWSCMDNQNCHCEYIDHRIRYTICKWILYVFSTSIFDGFKLSNIFPLHFNVK